MRGPSASVQRSEYRTCGESTALASVRVQDLDLAVASRLRAAQGLPRARGKAASRGGREGQPERRRDTRRFIVHHYSACQSVGLPVPFRFLSFISDESWFSSKVSHFCAFPHAPWAPGAQK